MSGDNSGLAPAAGGALLGSGRKAVYPPAHASFIIGSLYHLALPRDAGRVCPQR